MKQVTITTLEYLFITTLIDQLYAEEGFSDVDIIDMAREMALTLPECKGVLGSLTKKGLVHTYDEYRCAVNNSPIIYLADGLYHLHPTWEHDEKDNIELIVK